MGKSFLLGSCRHFHFGNIVSVRDLNAELPGDFLTPLPLSHEGRLDGLCIKDHTLNTLILIIPLF